MGGHVRGRVRVAKEAVLQGNQESAVLHREVVHEALVANEPGSARALAANVQENGRVLAEQRACVV